VSEPFTIPLTFSTRLSEHRTTHVREHFVRAPALSVDEADTLAGSWLPSETMSPPLVLGTKTHGELIVASLQTACR